MIKSDEGVDIIKNYYDQQQELYTANLRLQTLEEKKKIYFNATQPKATAIKDEIVSTSFYNSDTMSTYVIKIEKIDKEIDILKEEIKTLEYYLRKMEDALRKMEGSLEKIFVAKYIDGLKVKQIARRVHYSPSHIYRELSIINKIIKDDKK